jgi:hypothetical protein
MILWPASRGPQHDKLLTQRATNDSLSLTDLPQQACNTITNGRDWARPWVDDTGYDTERGRYT